MRTRTRVSVVITAASLSACALRGPLPPGGAARGAVTLRHGATRLTDAEQPPRRRRSDPRRLRRGSFTSARGQRAVTQAHTQAGGAITVRRRDA